jgi:hypothetical protein
MRVFAALLVAVEFYLVFLFRSAYLVVEFGMMERQAAVHSKCLERFLVLLQENGQISGMFETGNIRVKTIC